MGTGSLAVTISGISAANQMLRDMHLQEYRASEVTDDVVSFRGSRITEVRLDAHGRRLPSLNAIDSPEEIALHDAASACQWCLDAPCSSVCPVGHAIPQVMRRLECGNLGGAARQLRLVEPEGALTCESCTSPCQQICAAVPVHGQPVQIKDVLLQVIRASGAQEKAFANPGYR